MEKEYKLKEVYETENAIVRIFVPVNSTEEDKMKVINDLAQASYDLALDLYKKGKISIATN